MSLFTFEYRNLKHEASQSFTNETRLNKNCTNQAILQNTKLVPLLGSPNRHYMLDRPEELSLPGQVTLNDQFDLSNQPNLLRFNAVGRRLTIPMLSSFQDSKIKHASSRLEPLKQSFFVTIHLLIS